MLSPRITKGKVAVRFVESAHHFEADESLLSLCLVSVALIGILCLLGLAMVAVG